MFTRPDDLTDSDVASALIEGWSVVADDIEYAAVGFGSHHWRITADGVRWFVTVDDLDAKRRDESETRHDAASRLSAALTGAHLLRDAGLRFVIAPVPSRSGSVVQSIGDRYAVALYRHVDGETHQWGRYPTRFERLAILDRIAAIHEATEVAAGVAVRDDFVIPSRDTLETALSDRATPWGPGPHGDDARKLLDQHAGPLRRVLMIYDDLVDLVASWPERRVLTHGEPHRANTITTTKGVVVIDWDTALLAPPERDLWALIDEDSRIGDDYTSRSGNVVDPAAIKLYRLRWDLCEISLYVTQFRQPHRDTEDVRVAWRGLTEHLAPNRWTAV